MRKPRSGKTVGQIELNCKEREKEKIRIDTGDRGGRSVEDTKKDS